MNEIKIEQNTVSRDWTVLYKGRRFFVNFTESDGQTLALCNRDNWRICEETDDGVEEVTACVLNDSSLEGRQRAKENARIIDKLIAFCVRHWDNGFMQAIRRRMQP